MATLPDAWHYRLCGRSAYCSWVRQQAWPTAAVLMWQHIEGSRPEWCISSTIYSGDNHSGRKPSISNCSPRLTLRYTLPVVRMLSNQTLSKKHNGCHFSLSWVPFSCCLQEIRGWLSWPWWCGLYGLWHVAPETLVWFSCSSNDFESCWLPLLLVLQQEASSSFCPLLWWLCSFRTLEQDGSVLGFNKFCCRETHDSSVLFPIDSLGESVNRGLVCAHIHSTAQTQKIMTFKSLMGECRKLKHTQHAPSTKMEFDYLYGWIKKQSSTQKSPKKTSEPQRYN